jgi:hypothetical protein
MESDIQLSTHVKIPKVSDHENVKSYFLSDEAVVMLTKTEFLDKVFFDSKFDKRQEFGKALAHLCYNNL